MTHPRSRRGAALEALALAAVFFLSFALFYRLTLRPSSDISIHATWAAEGNFADLTSFLHHGAHPMWHVRVALVLRLGVPLAPAAAPVSYTHLDVYKRQAMGLPASPPMAARRTFAASR